MKTIRSVPIILAFLVACSGNPTPTNPGPLPIPSPNTAAYKLPAIQSLAQSMSAGSRLVSIQCDEVNLDGTSARWLYVYRDTSAPYLWHWFHATSDCVAFDSATGMFPGSSAIKHHWCNSDSALMLADRSYGAQFRQEHSGVALSAGLGEPVVPNSRTMWYITYRSSVEPSSILLLAVDASSGDVSVLSE